jgi:hypothetical protein
VRPPVRLRRVFSVSGRIICSISPRLRQFCSGSAAYLSLATLAICSQRGCSSDVLRLRRYDHAPVTLYRFCSGCVRLPERIDFKQAVTASRALRSLAPADSSISRTLSFSFCREFPTHDCKVSLPLAGDRLRNSLSRCRSVVAISVCHPSATDDTYSGDHFQIMLTGFTEILFSGFPCSGFRDGVRY